MNDLKVWQWDSGKSIAVDSPCQVHFAPIGATRALVVAANGDACPIPNQLLQEPKDIMAWVVRDGSVSESCRVRVTSRPMPSDYVLEPTDVETVESVTEAMVAAVTSSLKGVDSALSKANEAVDKANAIQAPKRGVDYWTEADVQTIHSYIQEQLGVVENGAY